MTKRVKCPVCEGRGIKKPGKIHGGMVVWFECENCNGTGKVEVPITNADHIRSMTDEELCAFILDRGEHGICFNDRCYHNDPNKGCDDCMMEWLRKPHEEGK